MSRYLYTIFFLYGLTSFHLFTPLAYNITFPMDRITDDPSIDRDSRSYFFCIYSPPPIPLSSTPSSLWNRNAMQLTCILLHSFPLSLGEKHAEHLNSTGLKLNPQIHFTWILLLNCVWKDYCVINSKYFLSHSHPMSVTSTKTCPSTICLEINHFYYRHWREAYY